MDPNRPIFFPKGTPARCNRCMEAGTLPEGCIGERHTPTSTVYRLQKMCMLECGHLDSHYVDLFVVQRTAAEDVKKALRLKEQAVEALEAAKKAYDARRKVLADAFNFLGDVALPGVDPGDREWVGRTAYSLYNGDMTRGEWEDFISVIKSRSLETIDQAL